MAESIRKGLSVPYTHDKYYLYNMAQYTDQLGRTVMQLHAPQRIVSLVPSLTELLYTLQLEKKVLGITRFCVHPAHWQKQKVNIGGTKKVHIDKVRALRPDLVIASKEENIKDQVEEIAGFAPVWVSDISSLQQALEAIIQLGIICNRQQIAQQLSNAIAAGFAQFSHPMPSIPAAYLIWKDPYMTIGGDTFIHQMMQYCGLDNVFANQNRYPVVTIEELQQSRCRVILLSSEPYPFREKQLLLLQKQLPGKLVQLADGELFSWYGSRLLQSAPYFIHLQQALQRDLVYLPLL